jgi:N-acylneuraminate cytidylyltransferase
VSTDGHRCIAFVFARGGSKGVPGKNIKALGGRPLIAYSIETARACKRIETVIVSTDDPEIADVARAFGAEVPFMRPPDLATDNAPEWLAWRHAINWFNSERGHFDAFVSLPATAPFRNSSDVDACLNLFCVHPDTDAVITVREAERSPYFNMVRLDADGYARLVIETTMAPTRRQDVPAVFDMTTVAYVARPAFVLSASRLFEGKVRTVQVPRERSLDIDTPFDFRLAEFLLQTRAANEA